MTFGDNLRKLRVSRKVTQDQMARDMNLSQSTITAYEVGVREPSLRMVQQIADYFHVPPSQLLPFGDSSDEEYIQRISEALKNNPKLYLLFERCKNFDDKNMHTMLAVASSIAGNL